MLQCSDVLFPSGERRTFSVMHGEIVAFSGTSADTNTMIELLMLEKYTQEGCFSIEGLKSHTIPSHLKEWYFHNTLFLSEPHPSYTFSSYIELPLLLRGINKKRIDDIFLTFSSQYSKTITRNTSISILSKHERILLAFDRLRLLSPAFIVVDDIFTDALPSQRALYARMIQDIHQETSCTIVLHVRDTKLIPLSIRSIPLSSELLQPSASHISHHVSAPTISVKKHDVTTSIAVQAEPTVSVSPNSHIFHAPQHTNHHAVQITEENTDGITLRIQQEMSAHTRHLSELLKKKRKQILEAKEQVVRVKIVERDVKERALNKEKSTRRSLEPARYVPKNKKLATPVLKDEMKRDGKSLPIFSRRG